MLTSNSSNWVGHELAVVQGKLEVVRNQEAHYEGLLSQLESLKLLATRERQGLEAREQELVAAFQAPINCLPNEILGQIFSFLAGAKVSVGIGAVAQIISPSITVSHVSRRWRAVALSTPQAWSNINLRSRWSREEVGAFISRSNGVPLDVCYTSPSSISAPAEVADVGAFLSLLANEWHRIRALDVNTVNPAAMVPFVKVLNEAAKRFDSLSSLSLNITTFNPPHTITDGLLKNNGPDHSYIPPKTIVPIWSRLSHLALQEIPLFNLPYHLVANLVSLELNYPPRKARATGRNRYWLTASAVLRFLSLTPKLEELVLNSTYPIFDGALSIPSVNQQTILGAILPIRLAKLRTICWSFPSASTQDAYNFMSLLDAPSLEKVDMWVENSKAPSLSINAARVPATPLVIDYPHVRELSFQCTGDDNSLNALRKFTFPNLEYLELGSIAQELSSRDKLRPIPRLESLFRDPRQPCLTHLALSSFDFNTEHSRSLFGYMPALVSLSLEFCSSAAHLIKILGEACTLDLKAVNPAIRGQKRGVRFCPRLEALSFWGCNDLRIETLFQVVLPRLNAVEGVILPANMLSVGCCERLVAAAANDTVYCAPQIVQILAIKKVHLTSKEYSFPGPHGVHTFLFSDGKRYTLGVFSPQLERLILSNSIQPYRLIVIEKSVCIKAVVHGREQRVILVHALTFIGKCRTVIGSPSPLDTGAGPVPWTSYSESTVGREEDAHNAKPASEILSVNANPHVEASVPAAGPTGSRLAGNAEAGVATTALGFRPIKPLRKSLRQVTVPASSPAFSGTHQGSEGEASSKGYPMAFVAHEVAPPSPIVYMRIHDCSLINSEHARNLRNVVADVIWIGEE